MKQRDRLAASLLAFFLGTLGAHWFYLGRRDKGTWYLGGWLISAALCIVGIGLLGFIALGVLCLYDFVTLLAMDPAQFDALYN